MTTEKTMREATNIAEVEGLVKDIRIEKKLVSGKDAITGEIDIQVEEGSVHTFRVFSYKLNKEGNESGLYKGIETVMNEYKSIEKHGIEDADKVRITQGKIGLNEYYGQDDQLRSFPQLSTNFINRVTDNFEPKAKFELEMVVASVKEEVKNEEETGRAIIKGYVPLYGGKVIPFEVVVAEKKAVDYVLNNYEKGNTVTVFGNIVNNTIVTKKEIEVGFGQPQEKITRTTVREYLVTGGTSPKDEDDEAAFDMELIKKALKERETYLKELKEKKKQQEDKKDNGNPFAEDRKKGKVTFEDDSDSLPF
ncbi:hypothetical protein [Paenibacillus naphthalenovorans]|uniref:Uncharacterized protein n=1 Tax=Paenibacillus naphthalenovorans TaxID=162209 RepID=A0A0U2UJT0_9BACL|nr:hypothetical protein [Paenibacillus naphthalenovorans]ALS22193.1 hypothetical protein IJ22_18190 [Paenibacillus naphthalenovorans]